MTWDALQVLLSSDACPEKEQRRCDQLLLDAKSADLVLYAEALVVLSERPTDLLSRCCTQPPATLTCRVGRQRP